MTDAEKQAAYREHRRQYALAHEKPYREDGGDDGHRSGNAPARDNKTKGEQF